MDNPQPAIPRSSLVKDLVIPVTLFASLGAFSWAIRGESGFGAVPGCMFAGLLWASAWYLLSRETSTVKSRRYNLGWCLFAIMVGIGLEGMHGWMVWPKWVTGFFDVINGGAKTIPLDPGWGYAWFFIAGTPWAGMGAVFLAWTGSKTPLNQKDWIIRIVFGVSGGLIALGLFYAVPQLFLPYYGTLLNYSDPTCTGCAHALANNRTAILLFGIYLGFLAYEVYRKDWLNVKLIATVGFVAGGLWSLFQVIQYLPAFFSTYSFNWWRIWESNAGVAIGIAYGLAYYLCNRPLAPGDPLQRDEPFTKHPNYEQFWMYATLIVGLGWAINNGVKGFDNIYFGNDNSLTQPTFFPVVIVGALLIIYTYLSIRKNPIQRGEQRDPMPKYITFFCIIFFTTRALGLMVTQPLTAWPEFAFFMYYIILAVFSMVILVAWFEICKVENACGLPISIKTTNRHASQ